jgi:hypothetical protein
MHGLIEAFVEWFKFLGMVVAAMIPAGLLGPPIGRYFAKLIGWDDGLLMAGCFFAILAAEAYAYDRFQRWRYSRNLKP